MRTTDCVAARTPAERAVRAALADCGVATLHRPLLSPQTVLEPSANKLSVSEAVRRYTLAADVERFVRERKGKPTAVVIVCVARALSLASPPLTLARFPPPFADLPTHTVFLLRLANDDRPRSAPPARPHRRRRRPHRRRARAPARALPHDGLRPVVQPPAGLSAVELHLPLPHLLLGRL